MAATHPFVAEALARDPGEVIEVIPPIGYGGAGIASTLPANRPAAAAAHPSHRRRHAALLRALRAGLGLGDCIAIFANPVARWLGIAGCRCAARRASLNRLTIRLDAWHLAIAAALFLWLLLALR